ncbi:MAG: aspartate kinase [Alphaproteobacteria bacterium]|nr:aspartate kinase [Alphaproteobacteria bacterium]
MPILVMKFGGTSVANIERIRNVASKVKREVEAGNQVAVVVSAMSGVTNQLVDWVREVSPLSNKRQNQEYDAVVATGEQVTSGLLALVLQGMGVPARSWQGWQIPLKTNDAYGKARIEHIESGPIQDAFKAGEVAVVAGFQGIGPDGRIATLGRGGSDTSAVAIAAALQAERCDIYTDVDGVYTCDPRIVTKAKKLNKVTYEEMLEMASQGAKVLQTRSVEMAMNHKVRVQVLSSFVDQTGANLPGTLLVDEDEIMEQTRITGIAYSRDEARITLAEVPNKPGVAAAIFGPLAKADINVDMIVQNVTEDGKATDMTFTVPKADLANATKVIEDSRATLEYKKLHTDANVAKVSIIGVGMRSHAGIAQEMFKVLGEKGINIQVISTSEIKISVLIAEEYTELALRALHTAFGLDAQ